MCESSKGRQMGGRTTTCGSSGTVSSPVLATSVVGPSVGETRVVVFVMVCLTNKMAETLAAMRCEHPVGHDALVPQVTGSSPWNQFRAIRSVCEG